jgi:hypothetical protein
VGVEHRANNPISEKNVLQNIMMSLGWSGGKLSRKLRPTPGCDAKEEEEVTFVMAYSLIKLHLYSHMLLEYMY